ncbi:MAG: hypothetical protein ABWY10_07575 [Tardiphaga sp.]|jgi:hypothetical protein
MSALDDQLDDHAGDPLGATTAELSEELIFLIASASTDEQRKRATELFRYLSRRLDEEAFRRGQDSVAVRRLPSPTVPLMLEAPAIQPSDQTSNQTSDEVRGGLIPQIDWLR